MGQPFVIVKIDSNSKIKTSFRSLIILRLIKNRIRRTDKNIVNLKNFKLDIELRGTENYQTNVPGRYTKSIKKYLK